MEYPLNDSHLLNSNEIHEKEIFRCAYCSEKVESENYLHRVNHIRWSWMYVDSGCKGTLTKQKMLK
jgi:hypothetical protein